MIFFCEECGRRNETGPMAIVLGRAVFTCTACGYKNNYLLPNRQPSAPAPDADIFFKAVDQDNRIVGVFIYTIRQGITHARMPNLLKPEDVHSLGWRLARGFDKGAAAMPDIQVLTVLIADKYFFVARRTNGQYLVLVTVTPSLPAPYSRLFHQWAQGY